MRGHYQRAVDGTVLQQIHAVTNSRATYGYRRVWAMVNRQFRAGYNRKRIRRVMRMHGLMLAPRVHRRHGRPHVGQVAVPTSNQRWCSDMFLIPCWSGEVVSVLFGTRGPVSATAGQDAGQADGGPLDHGDRQG